MPDYLIDDETDTITIPGTGGATVTMKRQATYDDELAVDAAMPPGVDRSTSYRCYVPARTMVMIESWTLRERDGSSLPINEEVLTKRLSRRVAAFIAEEAARRYRGRDEADEAPFDSRSEQPSTATPSTTAAP